MSSTELVSIVQLCLAIEQKAEQIYLHLAGRTGDERLQKFWENMSTQESMHIGIWERLLRLAETDSVPDIFEDPGTVRRELASILTKAAVLEERSRDSSSIANAFLLAYRLEFYMLNPGMATLFHFIKTVEGERDPIDLYDEHLSYFIQVLNDYSSESLELDMLGETIQRLWTDNKHLRVQTHLDWLTGVLNRQGMHHTMVPLAYLARRKGFPIGVLVVDVDDFKEVNDTFGHLRGDEVLQGIARTIQSNIRKSDLVGRLGGEEFLIFLSPVEPDSLEDIAENLRRRIAQEHHRGIPVTVSIGVSRGWIGDAVEKELEYIIHRADERLLRAKAGGKNLVVAE